MAYADTDDLRARYDERRLIQLVTDDDTEEIDPDDISGNTLIEAALDDATAWIDMAVTEGHRYFPEDLAALTPPENAGLVRLCCDLAYGFLVQRRGFPAAELAQLAPSFGLAQQTLERLRNGQMVFPIDANRQAGAQVDMYRPIDNVQRPPISAETRIFGQPRHVW